MYKRSLLLLLLFFSVAIKSTGVSTQYFLRLIHKDCYDLQNDLDTLSAQDLQQRLIVINDKKRNLNSKLRQQLLKALPLMAGGAAISIHQIAQNPPFLDYFYPPVTLGAAAIAIYWYTRHQALDEVYSTIFAEDMRLHRLRQAENQQRLLVEIREQQQHQRNLARIKRFWEVHKVPEKYLDESARQT